MPRPSRLGPYAPLSATYFQDDAIAEVGPNAELLYVRVLAFAASSQSDGYVSAVQVQRFCSVGLKRVRSLCEALVASGLWESVDGGYLIRSWLKWNRSAEEIGSARRKDRDRKAAGKGGSEPPPDPPRSSGNPNGFHPESHRNPETIPDGIPQDSSLARAHARPIHFTTRHTTSLQGTESGTEPAVPGTAERLLADYIRSCRKAPPPEIVEQLGPRIHKLLADGIDPDDVRAGITAWATKSLPPSTLPSFVNEVMNATGTAAKPGGGAATAKARGWISLAAEPDEPATNLRALPGEAS